MLLTTGKCVGGEEPFYASMSIVIPDLNSTVKWWRRRWILSRVMRKFVCSLWLNEVSRQ